MRNGLQMSITYQSGMCFTPKFLFYSTMIFITSQLVQ